jgi:hypothetical protein
MHESMGSNIGIRDPEFRQGCVCVSFCDSSEAWPASEFHWVWDWAVWHKTRHTHKRTQHSRHRGYPCQVHPEELLQSKPLLPIRQLPPSQCCGDQHLWSILDNPQHMTSSFTGSGPSTSYPPRGLRPWGTGSGTWGKESRNVFCPHSPSRYTAEQNRGRTAHMLHSSQLCSAKI